jgi:hypothetical protein
MTKTANVIRNMVAAVIVAGLGVLPCTTVARANVIYDFSGTCSQEILGFGQVQGCVGTATGVLTLTNDYLTVVSFSYSSSSISDVFGPGPVGGANGCTLYTSEYTSEFELCGDGGWAVATASQFGTRGSLSLVSGPTPLPAALPSSPPALAA